jgi:DNA-binding NarL/FixJ family response regulator
MAVLVSERHAHVGPVVHHVPGLNSSHARPVSQLTEREHVVLHLLDDGLTAQGIAARLLLSRRTVHKHLERIYRKLDAHDRGTALAAARDRALLMHHP